MVLPQGITKEFLEMTYPDQYYKNVIEPAKLGKGPVPGKIEMLSKSQPIKATTMQLQNLFSPGKYDAFRAQGTPAASKFLGGLGKGLGYLASLPAQAALMTLHSTPVNADEVEWEKQLMENQRFKQQQFMNKKKQQFMNKKKQDMQRRIREAEKKRIEQEKIKTAQNNWKPTYNPASSHAEAQATGGDYHGGHQSTVDGQTTDWGPNSAMIARGGLAQYAPRGSYFNGGLASLYRHGGF